MHRVLDFRSTLDEIVDAKNGIFPSDVGSDDVAEDYMD